MKNLLIASSWVFFFWMFVSGFGFSGGGSVAVEEGTTAPTDTTKRWVNSVDGQVYIYNSWAAMWLGPPVWIDFSRAADGHTLWLKFGNNIDGDTTEAAPRGYPLGPDSMVITAWELHSEELVINTVIKLFHSVPAVAPVELLDYNWKAAHDSSKLVILTAGAGVFSAHLAAGPPDPPDRPVVRFKFQKFKRKT